MIRPVLAMLACAVLTATCVAGTMPPTNPAPPATASAAPSEVAPRSTAAPAPSMDFTEVAIVPAGASGPGRVVGLARNRSSLPLMDVSVALDLLDASGASLGGITAPLLLSILQPGATSPFSASLPTGVVPTTVRVGLGTFASGPRSLADLVVDSVSLAALPDGVEALGLARNQGSQPALIQELALVWRDASGSLAGAMRAEVPGSPILPGEAIPWMAELAGGSEDFDVETFVSGTAVGSPVPSSLELTVEPAWHLTEQGQAFATGEVQNGGTTSIVPEVAVALWAQGELVGLQILRSPVPLPSGEALAFGAEDFPALRHRLTRLGVEAEMVAPSVILAGEPMSTSAGPLLLPTSVEQFEVIGSRVFLRGRVIHTGVEVWTGAGVYVVLRATDGELQSAAWLMLTPPAPGEEMEFRIDLPLPAGIDAALSEVDLRALAMPFAP